MSDELFTPTLQERPDRRRTPWRPQSIFYPAFFGGALAAATLGIINAHRLRRPVSSMVAIGVAGLAGLVVRVLLFATMHGETGTRVVGAIVGAAVWLVVLGLQRRSFRAFEYAGHEPSRLWGAGLAAFLGCGFVEAAIIYLLAG